MKSQLCKGAHVRTIFLVVSLVKFSLAFVHEIIIIMTRNLLTYGLNFYLVKKINSGVTKRRKFVFVCFWPYFGFHRGGFDTRTDTDFLLILYADLCFGVCVCFYL